MAQPPGGITHIARSMKKPIKKKRSFFRWLLRIVLLGILLFGGVVLYANLTAVWASHGRLFTEMGSLPKRKVGLVFGTSDRVNGNENLYFLLIRTSLLSVSELITFKIFSRLPLFSLKEASR